MEIRVGSYFHNPATDAQDEFHITLNENDGLEIFKEGWQDLNFSQRYRKLRGMANILTIQWAMSRGYRSAEHATQQIERITKEDLK